ncbi:uncharacterized protein LOC142175224 [Nicotiana tabacum]|uniref:Uncharacterized protein LOC142175224 n=1 Tax=Nicotiana tabacum TaxID=4097 RepID=A0AC58TL09_TOBAC
MPTYAKFFKKILSKRWKVKDTSVVKRTEHCASINLMPFPIFKKLEGEIGEVRSIPMSLQLADQTTIILEGIVEDVLVRVDKFVFPVDFIVVNMEENRESNLVHLGKAAHAHSGGRKSDLQDGRSNGGSKGANWRE